MTVTDTEVFAGGEQMVAGVRVIETAHVEVELTADQVAELDLQPQVRYRIDGRVIDDETGEPVRLPHATSIFVPPRWLRPPQPPADDQ